MKYLIIALAVLGCASQAQAQDPEAASEKDFLTEMPIVLSVSRLPQRLDETPGAVTILDRDMIRLSGARDVADLLRLVPGFQSSTSYEWGAPLASYHGGFDGYSNRMQVLIDGRSVYSPYFIGSIGQGLQSVAMADIERIEVLRGSNSAAYGARAFLGVVNIVTRDTADTQGVMAQLTTGENGIRDVQASLGWAQGAGQYRLSGDSKSDAGLAGSNGHNQTQRFNFRADLRPDTPNEIQLRAGGLKIDSGKGQRSEPADPLRDSSFDSAYLQLDWRRNLGADEDMAFSLSHSEESYRDQALVSLIRLGWADSVTHYPLGVPDSLTVDLGSGRSSNDALTLTHTFRRGSDVRVVWGGEFRSEQVSSKALYNTDALFVTDFTRLFGNAEWRIRQDLVLNAGAMLEHSSDSGDTLAPRVMLNWHAAEGQTLRAGISRANRPPSAFEKYSYVQFVVPGLPPMVKILASGKVQPESLVSRELGYLGNFPRLGLDVDVRLFQEQINGFIRQKNKNNVIKDYYNSEDFAIKGLEYQLKWRPWSGAQFTFNQAYTDIGSVDPSSSFAAPSLASTLMYVQKLPGGLDLSLMHQDSAAVMPQGGGVLGKLPMTRTDLRLAMPLRFGVNRGEVALVVQNLGQPTIDFSPEFTFQRRAFVTFRIEN